ncbi:unnamed protein product [Schistosoma rodhaini]|uniref:Tegumental antigen n=1 Tax=Schistosoma mansoni TaxID=6183 RepID=I4EC25_SCHMA|nr:unnamed protein product [Schistosoma rodhaini]CCE94315.1 tegumental antigen [Schistosoma mansoni]
MDNFIDIFSKIDKNYDDVITKEELEKFTRENHLDKQMVNRWLDLFSEETSNYITLQRFLSVLGIAKEQYEIIRRNTTQQNAALFKLGSDIEYISGDMMLSQQINVTNEARKLYQEYKSENKLLIATKLKEFLDKTFGRAWHVTVVDGSFASAHTEEVNTSFHFKMKNLCFIIWKTPDCRNE